VAVAEIDWRGRRAPCAAAAVVLALLVVTSLSAGCGGSAPAVRNAPPLQLAPPTRTATAVIATRASAPSPLTPATTAAVPPTPRSIPPAHPVPAAFRPAPGALSDAQVRSELAHLSALERRERARQLSPAPANLAGLLPWSLEEKQGVSVASVFRDYGLGLACGGVLGRYQLGVAHKTAPCGTLITFTYGGRSLTVPVIDRGPYIAGREWDLTGATAEALGFPGLGEIEWRAE
jgi:hypothetical protein